jgi:ABC-type phosphate/phosphonate transport system substrate-binding protein
MSQKLLNSNLIMGGAFAASVVFLAVIGNTLANKNNQRNLDYTNVTPSPNPTYSNSPANSLFDNDRPLIVGYVNSFQSQRRSINYSPLRDYLELELRKKYGNNVKVELNSAANNQEARSKIAQKKWDIAFTLVATNSVVAEDNKYEVIGQIFPQESVYRNVCFFVRSDSKIEKIKDFTPDKTIALPSDDMPLFVMPFYDLYGKKIKVSYGNRLDKIREKVRTGASDIGVDFCETAEKNSEFKVLSPSRVIPMGGVFLSRQVEKADERDYLKKILSEAPQEIQEKANYTTRQIANYSQFRRINDRANELLECVDFTRNPVNFYCTRK